MPLPRPSIISATTSSKFTVHCSAGSNTLTFTTCPRGLAGTDTYAAKRPAWLYISGGTGTAEPVAVTGGSCTATGLASGTITFTTAFSHSGAFTVQSATAGAQEAKNYATYLKSLLGPSDPAQILDPFEIVFPQGVITTFYAPFFVFSGTAAPYIDSNLHFRGGTILCAFYGNCVQVGDSWSLELLNGTTSNQLGSYNDSFRDMAIGASLARWTVNPSSPTTITAGSTSVTLTIPTCPSNFYATIPGQVLWLNGTTSGLEGTYRGTGEEVLVTGGSCANGNTNGTITISPAEPFIYRKNKNPFREGKGWGVLS